MQLKRMILKWPVLLLLTTFLWIGCKDKPRVEPVESSEPAKPTEQQAEPEKAQEPQVSSPLPFFQPVRPVKPWPGLPVLKIYYDREPLAQEWFKHWTSSSPYRIEQSKLETEGSKPLPLDGDLYVVSPFLVQKLRGLLEWQTPQSLVSLDQLKPLFTGHSFDPDNVVSLPWRWSPYVFYRKKTALDQPLPAFAFSGWTAADSSSWPDDWALLWAMKRHLGQGSANAAVNETEIKAIKTLKEQLAAHVLPEQECWKNFSEGKIKNTFALAAWRLKSGTTPDPLIDWTIPQQGTLIQFDQLMVPAKSPCLTAVNELVKQLLSIEGQNELTPLSGYFPVRVGANTEPSNAPIPLPSGSWMDSSEFLLLDLKALFTEQPADPTPTP
jgi:hypothetical protein